MKKEKFYDLCINAGFDVGINDDGQEAIVSPSDLDVIEIELQRFKNLLIEHFIQIAEKLKQNTNGELTPEILQATNSFNGGIAEVIKMMDGMK